MQRVYIKVSIALVALLLVVLVSVVLVSNYTWARSVFGRIDNLWSLAPKEEETASEETREEALGGEIRSAGGSEDGLAMEGEEKRGSYLEENVTSGPDGKKIVTNPQDLLVLVNKERSLPADYVPPDLVAPDVTFSFKEDLPKRLMRREAARALEELFKRATEDNINLVAVSGYRSYERQKEIFTFKARKLGEELANRTSAYPGQSEHQTGLAMDVSSPRMGYRLEQSFGDTPEGIWLAENAPEFGFIIRYPKGKEDITGYSYEPWHLRYVGVEVAREITARNITLEEFLADYYPD